MRCFVINLDQATARLDWMTQEFGRLGIAFERFPAVDKTALDMAAVEKIAGPASNGWAIGQVACFLSHIELWKRIASGDDAYCAIFEDDIHFSRDAAHFLRDSSWIPPGVDIVKIETTLRPVRLSTRHEAVMGHRLHALRSYHYGSAAYIVSKQAAARLLAAAAKIDRPVDDYIFDHDDSTRRQLVPALCVQDMFLPTTLPLLSTSQIMSSPQDKFWRPRPPLRKRLMREAKRLWRQITRDHGAPVPIELP